MRLNGAQKVHPIVADFLIRIALCRSDVFLSVVIIISSSKMLLGVIYKLLGQIFGYF